MQKVKKSVKSSKKPIIVAVSGYFNPLHVGHLDMIEKAKKLGDKLVVIVNNDKQVALKGRVPFMSEKDRLRIIRALRDVDQAVLAVDDYKLASGEVPVIKSLAKLRPNIFANGGDRHSIVNVPEYEVCEKYQIKMVDGLGKKIRASSIMIREAAEKREALEKKLLKPKK
ncbi:MAG: adenylyltransferase/cytidyltransferase family protein [Candidatus Falkowbacteria bacterium]|nr:adenylyltransferase/cytidyltransferase family protein [Candidatus Falkowbacteria bacterium]